MSTANKVIFLHVYHRPNTVLILGAGVSVPFGLPVGAKLIDDIAASLDQQLKKFIFVSRQTFSVSRFYPVHGHQAFLEFPFLHPLLWKINAVDADLKVTVEQDQLAKSVREEVVQMEQLKKLLQNQTSDSVDDFIIMNPSYSERVKICIAAEFIRALYQPDEDHNNLKLLDLGNRYLSSQNKSERQELGERNWIHRLINLIRLGIYEKKVTGDNKILIVTFNYDTILEHVLDQQFANTENGAKHHPDYREFIEIIHVHGQFGELSNTLDVPGQTCWEWAKGIKVIREGADEYSPTITKARTRAKEIIEHASEIYCCGFAFAKANTNLLGLKEGLPSYCQIWCLRILGHAAIWSGLVVSIPSLNVTPVMTFAR